MQITYKLLCINDMNFLFLSLSFLFTFYYYFPLNRMQTHWYTNAETEELDRFAWILFEIYTKNDKLLIERSVLLGGGKRWEDEK